MIKLDERVASILKSWGEPIDEKEIPAYLLALAARLLQKDQAAETGNGSAGDRLLEVDEAAERLGMKKTWLWTHADRLPFAVRMGRKIRYSERGIEEYIKTKRERSVNAR